MSDPQAYVDEQAAAELTRLRRLRGSMTPNPQAWRRQPRDARGKFVEMNPSAAADFIERKMREEADREKAKELAPDWPD